MGKLQIILALVALLCLPSVTGLGPEISVEQGMTYNRQSNPFPHLDSERLDLCYDHALK